MSSIDPQRWQATVERLRNLRSDGMLTTAHVRLAAEGLGVSVRTVWRRVNADSRNAPGQRGPARFALTQADRDAFAYYRGNIAAVHRARAAVIAGSGRTAGGPVPQFLAQGWTQAQPLSLRALQRAFAREMSAGTRAALAGGEQARRQREVYLTRGHVPRNQVWELDHKELPILVLPPRGPARKPWLTNVVDCGTRALIGWAIALQPTSGVVLTALRMALVHEPDRGPFGAVPALVRVDGGLEFSAAAVADALNALCVATDRLPPYQPHLKGKVERLHRTMEQTLLTTLPGYTKGPRDAAGRLYGPLRDDARSRAEAEHEQVGPWRLERFCGRFADWVTWYNQERAHSQLGGRTPVQAWNDDPFALRRIPAQTLRHLLLAEAERTVHADGVHLGGLAYIAPELHGRRGQKVEIRYMPHDDRFVEVFIAGQHLCTAYPQGHLTPEQAEAFRAHARQEAAEVRRIRRRVASRARMELAPLTDDNPAQESRLGLPPEMWTPAYAANSTLSGCCS
jgi:putative transposase